MNLMKNVRQIKKRITSSKGSGITLTNNETKDIIKVIKSLETEGILLKGTTKKNKVSRRRISEFSLTINVSWSASNKKCIYTIR